MALSRTFSPSHWKKSNHYSPRVSLCIWYNPPNLSTDNLSLLVYRRRRHWVVLLELLMPHILTPANKFLNSRSDSSANSSKSFMRGRVQCWSMSRILSMKSVTICVFFLLQIIAPITIAEETQLPPISIQQTEQLNLKSIGIVPNEDLVNGWFDDEHGAGEITLLYRTASVVPIDEWSRWTASDILNGRYVITHQLPVPTEWSK